MTEEIKESKLNIVSFNKEKSKEVEEIEYVFETQYVDGTIEYIDADSCAIAEEMPGFLAFWRENPYTLEGFINTNSIKKLRVIDKKLCLEQQ